MFRCFIRSYHTKVIKHFESPRNVGTLIPELGYRIGTGLVGSPACGDVMRLQIKEKGGRVVDAKFKTFGCGSAIASSSVVTEAIIGKTLQEAGTLTNKEIAKELRLPPVKLHCSMLAEDAVKAAIFNLNTQKVHS
jgi:Fe-S cluster assembly scaffold IscU